MNRKRFAVLATLGAQAPDDDGRLVGAYDALEEAQRLCAALREAQEKGILLRDRLLILDRATATVVWEA